MVLGQARSCAHFFPIACLEGVSGSLPTRGVRNMISTPSFLVVRPRTWFLSRRWIGIQIWRWYLFESWCFHGCGCVSLWVCVVGCATLCAVSAMPNALGRPSRRRRQCFFGVFSAFRCLPRVAFRIERVLTLTHNGNIIL